MLDLKPCPFCGSIAHVAQLKWSATKRYFVACSKWGCIASEHNTFGRFFDNRDDAANAWNRMANYWERVIMK
jgi:hypothetical protein